MTPNDIIERAEAAMCGEGEDYMADLVPELVAELKAARAENNRLAYQVRLMERERGEGY
jgi:hypothetical protein